MSGRPVKESARAQTAYERYLSMPQPRSLKKLAEELLAEQQGEREVWEEERTRASQALAEGIRGEYERAARAALNRPAPKVQSLEVIHKRLKEWSATFHWQQRVSEADREQGRKEYEARTKERNDMYANHALNMRAVNSLAVARILTMLKADQEAMNRWQGLSEQARAAADQLLAQGKAVEAAQLIERVKDKPRAFFGPTALVQLAALALDTEHEAREVLTVAEEEHADAALPDVLTVNLTNEPPPVPVDPTEDVSRGSGSVSPEDVERMASLASQVRPNPRTTLTPEERAEEEESEEPTSGTPDFFDF